MNDIGERRRAWRVSDWLPECKVADAAKRSTAVGVEQISEFIHRCADSDGIPCRNPGLVAECFTLLLRGWYGYAIVGEQPVTPAERKAWVEQMVDMLITGRSGW